MDEGVYVGEKDVHVPVCKCMTEECACKRLCECVGILYMYMCVCVSVLS